MAQDNAVRPDAGPDQTKLALERTFLAHERTLMAWIRTATSLIGFGFGLYKFFFFLREQESTRHVDQQVVGPRTFGLSLIGIGVFALVVATWQHRQQMKQLRAQYADVPMSLSLVVAALIAFLGILAFVAAVFRE